MGDIESQDHRQELARRAREGDREAFDRLVAGHRPRFEALVHARLRKHFLHHTLEVDDVLQETLARALAGIGRFTWETDDAFARWIGGIAQRVILEEARRRRRHTTLELIREPAGSGISPSTALRREERFDRLREALDRLSPEHREVITLARLEGLRMREIAARMGRSEEAVKKLLSRALKNLKRSFGDTESFRLPGRTLEQEER